MNADEKKKIRVDPRKSAADNRMLDAAALACMDSARNIYLQQNGGAEWQAYLTGLLDLHERKYKLVPMLRGIR